MTKTWWWVVRIAVCPVTFALGWAMASRKPATVREVEKVVTVEKKVEVVRTVTVAATHDDTADETHWRTRTVYKPGGTTVVTREVVRNVEHRTGGETTAAASHEVVVERERLVYRDKLVAVAQRARWAIGANVGMGLDGKPRYGGGLELRVVGPLWLTGSVDVPTRAAMLGARLEF